MGFRDDITYNLSRIRRDIDSIIDDCDRFVENYKYEKSDDNSISFEKNEKSKKKTINKATKEKVKKVENVKKEISAIRIDIVKYLIEELKKN